MKYLILRERKDDYFLKNIKDENIWNIYKKKNIALSLWYKILVHLNKRFTDCFFDEWKNKVAKKDAVIIFDTYYTERIGELIKEKNPKTKVILYFWNKVSEAQKRFLGDKNIDEFWTFDETDAEKLKIKFNPQFYWDAKPLPKEEIEYDALFVGRTKNRGEKIGEVRRRLEKSGLRTKFLMIDDEKQLISYEKYLVLVKKTRAIVDIVDKGQTGLSLRCMEGLFLGRKVITNNRFVKNYDFYDEKNIFILDDFSGIKQFLDGEGVLISEKIREKYTYESWLSRILEEAKK